MAKKKHRQKTGLSVNQRVNRCRQIKKLIAEKTKQVLNNEYIGGENVFPSLSEHNDNFNTRTPLRELIRAWTNCHNIIGFVTIIKCTHFIFLYLQDNSEAFLVASWDNTNSFFLHQSTITE